MAVTTPACVVVGAGPGGTMLAFLLARAEIPVTLLESHHDFDRDFRGDSLHPWTLELLDELGLVDDLLALPHHPARYFRLHTSTGSITAADYGRLHTRFNYIALIPQARFLDFVAARAAALPTFELQLGAKVTDLLDEDGTVTGVRYRDSAGAQHELRAPLVVAADGRFSRARRLAGLPAKPLSARSDLLWFRLPREHGDPPEADVKLYFGVDHYVGLLGGHTTGRSGTPFPRAASPPHGTPGRSRSAGSSPSTCRGSPTGRTCCRTSPRRSCCRSRSRGCGAGTVRDCC